MVVTFYIGTQERERKERFEEAVRQKELKKAEMAQK